jgi:integrase
MFGWAQRQGLIAKNVVADSRVPRGRAEDEGREIHPFTSDGLRAVYEAMKEAHPEHADVALFLGRTGLRWGELAALRVGDVQEVPQLSLRVSRSAPDGHPIRNQPKGGRARTVPLTDDVAPLVRQRMEGRRPDELLFTTPRGSRLNNRNWCRDSEWTTKYGLGRRVHDLRHTAATVWITMGLDAKTIQTWLGHATMKMTMDKYGHYMGQDSDTAALAKLNAALAGGTSGARVTNLRTAE